MAATVPPQPRKVFKSVASPERTVDLAFAMDCTGSMESYIENARQNIRKIAEDILSHEKVDLRFALVEYRDHPPQEETFVTNVLDFTNRLVEMKSRLDQCAAVGGGDAPEAVADALHAVLKLSWRPEAVKICVLIADAPPHGLVSSGDGFPNGCPCDLDPMVTAHELAKEQIAVYTVGCEPSLSPYKEWFMAISHITSGQYLPLASANVVAQIVIAGTMEEISLSGLTATADSLVLSSGGRVTDEELTRQLYESLKGTKTKLVRSNVREIQQATEMARRIAGQRSMAEVRGMFTPCNSGEADVTAYAGETYDAVDSSVTMEQASRMMRKAITKFSK